MLLAAGADPSISAKDQRFPLFFAAQEGNVVLAEALLRANANVNAMIDRPCNGTALSVAAFKGNEIMVKLLLDAGCDTSKTAVDGHHPLTVASIQGRTDIVTMLLERGANVNAKNAKGWTALAEAALIGSCDVVKKLLEGGAHVNQPSRGDGQTALHMAAQEGFDEVINILIAAGAQVDARDRHQGTPLHNAATGGNAKCTWTLLRAGANVSARDHQGSAPLHDAAFKGHTEVIEVLLAGGAHADVNLEDKVNRTPLSLAAAFADAKAVILLLDAGADINQLDGTGKTALFAPSDLKIVKVLLERGANVRALNRLGATALHAAAFRGASTGVICALFKGGADPTVKDHTGKTAADYARIAAVHKKGRRHEDAAKMLDLLEAKHRSTHST